MTTNILLGLIAIMVSTNTLALILIIKMATNINITLKTETPTVPVVDINEMQKGYDEQREKMVTIDTLVAELNNELFGGGTNGD